MDQNAKTSAKTVINGEEQNLKKQMAEFGISVLFQYFMYILAKFNTFSRSWKAISQFNTFNTAWNASRCFIITFLLTFFYRLILRDAIVKEPNQVVGQVRHRTAIDLRPALRKAGYALAGAALPQSSAAVARARHDVAPSLDQSRA